MFSDGGNEIVHDGLEFTRFRLKALASMDSK
jgi:hypothetical protein